MKRRIKYIFYILVNLIRLPVIKLLCFNHLKFSLIQLVSPQCDLEIFEKGHILLRGRVHTEKNTLLSSGKGGVLTCGSIFLNRNSMIVCRDRITIENGTTIGPNTVIYDHDHSATCRGQLKLAPVYIEKNVWIGANATILKGVRIGEGSIVAAGAVVTKNVPPHSMAAGIPAKIVKHFE